MEALAPGRHGNHAATTTAMAPAPASAARGHATTRILAAGGGSATEPPLRCPTAPGTTQSPAWAGNAAEGSD